MAFNNLQINTTKILIL